ncbi:hypothetical protein V6N11_012812 [Hibiscus sabdariffa]|uniref:Uncharacterized protein n=1 Tax=Hibiscus sabdariffa TaxID=183260 RepID=A0ABR2A2P0_9ROSI
MLGIDIEHNSQLFVACAATSVSLTNSSAATNAATAFNIPADNWFTFSTKHHSTTTKHDGFLFCSNYYSELADPIQLQVCNWCQSEERNSRSSKKSLSKNETGIINPSEDSGDKIKQLQGKRSGTPSPRSATRSSTTATNYIGGLLRSSDGNLAFKSIGIMEGNMAADTMAKINIPHDYQLHTFDEPPSVVQPILDHDLFSPPYEKPHRGPNLGFISPQLTKDRIIGRFVPSTSSLDSYPIVIRNILKVDRVASTLSTLAIIEKPTKPFLIEVPMKP